MNKKEYVVCPICGKELKYINNSHLKRHGYLTEKEFLKDYPVKLKTDDVDKNQRRTFKTLNQDNNHQTKSAKCGWDDDRRK